MPLKYSINQINTIVNGRLSGGGTDKEISHLVFDSRSIAFPGTSLFFAIKSHRNDGHRFIRDAHQKGIRSFVVTAIPDDPLISGSVFIRVENTITALQAICSYHRNWFNIPVIGITGSNGKTVVKEWLFQLLGEDHKIVRSPKSYNSQLGAPLSVWQMDEGDTLGIFEAGISLPGEMKKLEALIRPTTGIITNIGEAHGENFSSMEEKTDEKLNLFKHVSALIYCSDYTVIENAVTRSGLKKNINCITWSKKNRADLEIGEIKKDQHQSVIHGNYKGKKISIAIPFTDDASIENALHCWLLMLQFGYDNSTIQNRMLTLFPVAMRLELKDAINNCTLINDFYNSDVSSLNVAIDFMNQQQQHKTKTVILSDILQSGKDEHTLYSEVAGILKNKDITKFIGIGEAISRQAELFTDMSLSFYKGTEEFLENFPLSSLINTTVLLKGARIFEFEKISRMLQHKSHETVLEINLNALINNLNFFRSKISSGTKVMAMVKAFSYGSGSYEIANVLQFNHIDYLAVAYTDEGVELRKAGISTPIMVMNPEPGCLDLMFQYSLEPEIYGFRILEQLGHFIAGSGITASTPFPVHIKVDSGMHRLGFLPSETGKLANYLKFHPDMLVKSVFSHLSATDEPQHDDFTLKQIASYSKTCTKIQDQLPYPFLKHILNSAGTVRFPAAHFDMVRLGIGLYGVSGDVEIQKALQQVSRLKSIISQIKTLSPGEAVGYNRMGISDKKRTIAIVPIGYADGLNRRFGNGGGVFLLHEKFVPLVGNVCMDMCMLDITGIAAREGDEIIVFGDSFHISEFSRLMGTIPYEVLTGISRRVKRIYYYE